MRMLALLTLTPPGRVNAGPRQRGPTHVNATPRQRRPAPASTWARVHRVAAAIGLHRHGCAALSRNGHNSCAIEGAGTDAF